jgi:phytoene dehydrogenase-like protein
MFGFATEGRRLEISAQPERFASEIDREFPEVRQLVDEFYVRLASANSAIDSAFSRDAVWPPSTFWERIEAARTTSQLPFVGDRNPGDLLVKFPPDHPYRELATLPAVFASDIDYGVMGLPALALARLHGSWTRGVYALGQGEDELESFLLERIAAHGGVCQLDRRIERIVVEGNRVRGIVEDGSPVKIGTDAVITSLSGEAIAELAAGEGITKKARYDWPNLSPTAGRFAVSIVVDSRCLPRPLGYETFLLPPESRYPDPRRPVVHLQRYEAENLGADAAQGETLLLAEAIVPAEGALTLLEARQAVLNTVRFHLPFLDEHLKLIDSPHDGLPLEDFTTGVKREIDRIHVTESSPKPEFMDYQWTVDPPGFLGIAGEPIRGPVPGSYLVGKTTLPALGQEGELISAWSVARILTRKDATRQRRRRQLWNKFETG